MKKNLTVLLSILSLNLYAIEVTVKDVRGTATVLKPKRHDAEPVTIGQKIPEDSSIVTKDKSIVVLDYPDKSKVTIGQNSKIVIELIQKNNKPGLIQLLKGMLRAKVSKDHNSKSDKEKFLVRSRTASLGVRGTEFQFGINEDQTTTSLLTYEGRVELSNKPVTKEDVIASNEVLVKGEIVAQGEFSNVKEQEVLKPVKIDEKQFIALAKNETLIDTQTGLGGTLEKTSSPVIDFNSGKVLKGENLKIDTTTGEIIDDVVVNPKSTVKESGKQFVIALSNSYDFYQYKNGSARHFIRQHSQKLSMASKIKNENSEYYIVTEIYNFLKPKTHKVEGVSYTGYQYDRSTMMGLKFTSKVNEIGNFNYQYTLGVAPKTYFKDNGQGSVVNETESAPEVTGILGYTAANSLSAFLKSSAYLVDFDKLGLRGDVGLKKDFFSHYNFTGAFGIEQTGTKQHSTSVTVGLGTEF